MNLRDSILSLMGAADYVPLDQPALLRELGLNKKDKTKLSHEVRLLLSQGRIVIVKKDRLCIPKDADLVTGKISFRQGGSAYLSPEQPANEPPLPSVQVSAEDTGVAMHGDRVVVRLHAALSRAVGNRAGGEPTGKVIRILERGSETLTGELRRSRLFFYVAPDDPRFTHDIMVPDPAKSDVRPVPAVGDKVVVKLHEWTQRHTNPEGEITERLGVTFEPRAELAAIYHKFKLDTEFPADVMREANALPSVVREAETVGRVDYREIPTFTIDPDDAKDFDDALSIEHLQNGDVRIGVHIADVSAYVRPGTALDKEAHRRGNSTYLVGTVVPMLPHKLSNGLCSLVEAQDRLTKAVFLTFRKGRLVETTYANTVICSRKRLTYRQAYAILKENDFEKIRALPLPPAHQTGSTGRALSVLSDEELSDLQGWIREMWDIASKLRRDRMRNGSLDLDMPEAKIFVDKDGYADRIERIEHDESHQLIEEFMLAANEALARLTREKSIPSIYRVHDEPIEEKLFDLRNLLGTFGIKTGDLTKRSEISKLLITLRTHPQGYTLRTQLLRSLRRACYRHTSDGHYGLAKKDYTHFTSPIRRYSDLIVHRVLDFYLIKHEGHAAPPRYQFAYNVARMASIAEHLSLTEQNSMEAERESQKVKLVEFFDREVEKKKKTVFDAIITDVRNHGMFIELPESMTFGMVHVSTLPDFFQLNNAGTMLIGRRSKEKYELGQKIKVVTHKVDRFKRQIDFRLA